MSRPTPTPAAARITHRDRKPLNIMVGGDRKRVYGMRPDDEGEALFAVDIASGAEKAIGKVGKENRPQSNLNPAMSLSLAPDGKSVVYSAGRFKDNLWMLEGFAVKSGLFKRLGL